MKRSISLKLTSAIMAGITFTTLGVGCGGPSDGSGEVAPSSQTRQQHLSGQALYKGMVFGVGPAAHHFDDLWQRPEIKSRLAGEDMWARREMAAERVIEKVAQLNPSFFERFSKDLRSGNHLTIDRLLTDTREVTMAAADALRKENGLKEGSVLSGETNVERGTWFYEETVVAVAIAAVLLVVVTQIDVTPVMDGPQTSALRRDQWVNSLANKHFAAE